MHRIVWILLVTLMSAAGVSAQTGVPDFRFIATRDVDFYGSDLDAMFDTSLSACVQACAANEACSAFTFNGRSNACFPKSAVSSQNPYVGALSAVKEPTADAVQAVSIRREAELAFLLAEDFKRAQVLARDLGLRHPAGGRDAAAAVDAARTAGNTAQAVGWTGVALSLTDRADLWSEYARLLLKLETRNSDQRRDAAARAIGAAINGYLRAEAAGTRATALAILAEGLERAGRGRLMIPALRLARQAQPRRDLDAALDAAIGKYGFRVVGNTVESDTAAPRICAQFSEPLAPAGTDYGDFVRLPDPTLVVQIDGSQLCVDGVEHGQRYRLTLRNGLPAASGELLHRDVDLALYVRDRSPQVRFAGRSYVLPMSAGATLPVETVNLATVDLTLRRISDRNVLRAMQDGYFGRPLSAYQDRQFAGDVADEIWTGTAEVALKLNTDMTTLLPMGKVIADQPPGIYALTARVPGADPYDDPGATQWFVLSDMGLSTWQGTEGLHVQVRGLADADPKAGVEVTLLSRANAVLGREITGADGFALFASGLVRGTGGAAPALVFARDGGDDLGFLALTDPAFDLSDRGVEGRPAPGPVDVFLTTDRGAYRAGETIHATALARDSDMAAITGLPLTAVLTRPDGVEYARRVSGQSRVGGHVFSLPVGAAAPRGTWRLDIHDDPKAAALASQTVLVEDFLPERFDFELGLQDTPLRQGRAPTLRIAARYLFGAPGADLGIDGQVVLRAVRDVAGWPGFSFGRHDAPIQPRSSYFGGRKTSSDGRAEMTLDLPEMNAVGLPMQAEVIARLSDGAARPVERRLVVPVAADAPMIGISTQFDDVVAEGAEADFEVIAVGTDGQPRPMAARWTLNRVETRYQWYQLYGNWNWEPTTRRTRIATGDIALASEPQKLSVPVEWGRYELVIEGQDGDWTETSVAFDAGWYAAADASATPDRLELSLDRPSYAPGDTATLRIVAPSDGKALVSVLANRLIEKREVAVTEGENLVSLDVTTAWGTGAYVSAAVIRPMDAEAGRNPSRALGIAHAAVAPVGKVLDVAIDVPDIAAPRQTQQVRVRVDGATNGDEIWLTLAAIDLGILNLTGFESPDPQAHYFGQRRLGVEMRDLYGRLIDGLNGAPGTVRSGGDAGAAMRMQAPPPTQDLMASFSGPVRVDSDGTAVIDIDLPAFNGTVRVMAVAWSDTAVGQAETDMVVRDPVVVTATVPRFLAPGDAARLRLDLTHADGPAGEMKLSLSSDGDAIRLGTAPAAFVLAKDGRASFDVPVTANHVGDPKVNIALTTPDGRKLSQSLVLPVRANDPVVARSRRFSLDAGETFLFGPDVFADMRPGTGKALLSAGPLARFDAPRLLSMLDRYPYGCTEQVTSQALPLLYLSSVAQASGLGDGPAVMKRIDAAIARVLARQAPNGAFGLWRAEAGDTWLDAYVTDFLSRARTRGHAVPDIAFRSALDNLRNRVNYAPDFHTGGEDIAFALMVLAREGAAAIGDLRYYADAKGDAFATPLAAAQLGAALAAYGDPTRADAMFARAARMIAAQPDVEPAVWRSDFGTRLRDAAGVLALATEAGSTVIDSAALTRRVTARQNHLSPQEASWSLLAAQALIAQPEGSGLLVNDAPFAGPFVQVLEEDANRPMMLTATSGRGTEITMTTLGVPRVAPPAGGTGYAISRSYYAMDGAALTGDVFTVGDRFVTVLHVTPFENAEARLIIDDPLPAGIEIDNPSLLRSGDVRALDWLQPSKAEHSEFRTERFVSAVNLRDGKPVTLAYVARAVTPGAFHHPAALVEDMYRPRLRARTATGRITVRE